MILTVIDNGLEILKYYILFRYLFCIPRRKERWNWLVIVSLFALYSIWDFSGEMISIIVYSSHLILQMKLLFRMKAGRLTLVCLGLAFIIDVLDTMSRIAVWIFWGCPGLRNEVVEITSGLMTLCILTLFLLFLKNRFQNKKVTDSMAWLFFTFVWGIGDWLIISYMQDILSTEESGGMWYLYTVIALIVMYLQMGMMIFFVMSRDEHLRKETLNRKYLELASQHYQNLLKKENDTKKFRHDIQAHLAVLQELCQEKEYEPLQNHMDAIKEKLHSEENVVTVGNRIVDAVLKPYCTQAGEMGINFMVKGFLSEDCGVSSYDLCTLFDNLVKNAFEAAAESDEKTVELIIRQNKNEIMIFMKNNTFGKKIQKNGRYQTTKKEKENHGFGIENIQDSLKKYYGKMSMKDEEGKMKIYISLFGKTAE